MTPLCPLALYIHIPWCVRKCPYCDFNSHRQPDELPAEAYVEALLRDLESDLPRVWGRRVSSIFIGGGTPSLMPADAIAELLQGVRARIGVTAGAEITLEANPGTAETQRFRAYRAAGVNRLSLGVQSFHDPSLLALGRIHDAEQALQAVALARRAGFERINLDLMFGLPGQTEANAARDLDTALALDPGHLSYYQLTLEPNTLFHHDPPQLPGDERIERIQRHAIDRLAGAGYRRYEVSAFAKSGASCRHNVNYWTFGDYLGIGAGAHAKISGPEGILRLWRHRHPRDYLETPRAAGERWLTPADRVLEFMMNALRLVDGVADGLFTERTGLPAAALEPGLRQARQRGLICTDSVRPTARGIEWLNEALEHFVPD